jgi:hypothetical protein
LCARMRTRAGTPYRRLHPTHVLHAAAGRFVPASMQSASPTALSLCLSVVTVIHAVASPSAIRASLHSRLPAFCRLAPRPSSASRAVIPCHAREYKILCTVQYRLIPCHAREYKILCTVQYRLIPCHAREYKILCTVQYRLIPCHAHTHASCTAMRP